MTTRHFVNRTLKLFIGVMCAVLTASCGSELLRTGRSPVFLQILQIEAAAGNTPDEFVANLQSDVQVIVEVTVGGVTVQQPTIFNDLARISLAVVAKDQTGATTSSLNAVTITRYRVNFRRSDGRNTPGLDVPYGFDGATPLTIDAGGTGQVIFDIVRHQMKLDPPLRNLVGFRGIGFIHTIAEITIWGHDQNGNEVSVSGSMDVQFSDFGDE